MRATGIVRKIDELGRIVIPKELRKTMKADPGTPLEIFVDRDAQVILKKYSPMKELRLVSEDFATSLSNTLELPVLVSDRDSFVNVTGEGSEGFFNQDVGSVIEKAMDTKQILVGNSNKLVNLSGNTVSNNLSYIIAPIISGKDVLGSITVFSQEDSKLDEGVKFTIATGASFIGKQMKV